MKKVLLTLAVVGVAASVLAQGTVQFINFSTANGVNARIYGPEVGALALSKTGNTTAGLPPGTQTYTGALLGASTYRAQLFAATGTAAEGSLVGGIPISTFRSGTGAGIFALQTATLTGVAKDAPLATLQVRAWDNASGNYPTWAEAEVAWQKGLIAAGKSPLLEVAKIGGDFNTSPYLAGLQSFNIYFVPEPSTMALAGLGAAAMLIFRRRK